MQDPIAWFLNQWIQREINSDNSHSNNSTVAYRRRFLCPLLLLRRVRHNNYTTTNNVRHQFPLNHHLLAADWHLG